ncbi:MAG TPA: hypothetical protein VD837_10025, partial [Terriglobales bacterium]|nr:hypothetical protein [Terriglobales bacterium]
CIRSRDVLDFRVLVLNGDTKFSAARTSAATAMMAILFTGIACDMPIYRQELTDLNNRIGVKTAITASSTIGKMSVTL